jgi:hypothetical protein
MPLWVLSAAVSGCNAATGAAGRRIGFSA